MQFLDAHVPILHALYGSVWEYSTNPVVHRHFSNQDCHLRGIHGTIPFSDTPMNMAHPLDVQYRTQIESFPNLGVNFQLDWIKWLIFQGCLHSSNSIQLF